MNKKTAANKLAAAISNLSPIATVAVAARKTRIGPCLALAVVIRVNANG